MLYEYTKTQLPYLQYIHDEVAGSAMTDKSIEWCNWEEDEQKLKVNFTNTLSTEDETILDGIVAACPVETYDAPEEMTLKNGDKYIGFQSPVVLTEDTIYVLPEDGADGQALLTDGEKNLSFQTIPTHTQNTDAKLDEGGDNEVSAAEIAKLGSGHITILPSSYDSKSGFWNLTVNAVYYLCGLFANISADDGDNVSYKIYLPAGTYKLLLLANKNANCGIVDIDIDGVEVASFDLYSSSQEQAHYFKQEEIEISSPGLKELKLRLDGKNVDSSAYQLAFSCISLWRTA